MKLKIKKLKNLTNTKKLADAQTPFIAGGMPPDITNYELCNTLTDRWSCTRAACQV
ncbi:MULTISPECIES: hypothetical protein [Pseudoalteromonas]|uniref:hypothetical protein n=1 Tax=Pseudoalteromonas TaxID=53246 RepID=UPI001485FC60|nr:MULTISPECIES: hypothetical protein [Pseudoalteromonas]MCO7187160.1 hypothetical protein [Pseudoalteromonas sp. XMcav2-N]